MGDKDKYLIVDTNIAQFAASKPVERSTAITNLILEKEKSGFKKAISVVTGFEAVQNRNSSQEERILENLNLYTQLETNKTVYLLAGWLSDFYRAEHIPDSQINTCDKFIAATSILTDSIIMTADGNDFPRPFFNEAATQYLFYTDKDRQLSLKIYFLKPDYSFIRKSMDERRNSK